MTKHQELGSEPLRSSGNAGWTLPLLISLGSFLACGGRDETIVVFADVVGEAAGGVPAFLGFPADAEDWSLSPPTLSQSDAFADLADLDVVGGMLPYSVQSPLWSDGARKRRWLGLPSGTQIGFSEQGSWSFPEGTVFIKHFDLALDERAPDQLTRLETRFLIAARGGGYYGLVYKWDEEQRDARLLSDGGDEDFLVVQEDGSTRNQTYAYPRQSSCGACHSAVAGYVMGVGTAQLNGEHVYGDSDAEDGQSANQLVTLAQLGVFDRPLADSPVSDYPSLAALDDDSRPVEQRVRSYWDSNCSMCHNADAPLPSWDARYETPLRAQAVLMAEPYNGARPDDARLVVPGEPERSLLYLRASSATPGVRMPPLLRNRVDSQYVELLERWILALPKR